MIHMLSFQVRATSPAENWPGRCHHCFCTIGLGQQRQEDSSVLVKAPVDLSKTLTHTGA